MASYVVMEPPHGDEEAVLVRDGFSVPALLLPAVWLLWHRLWIEALAVLAAAAALAGLGALAGSGDAASVMALLLGILIGLEGSALRLAALRRRGWREWGVVEADNARDAEIRYLAEACGDEALPGPAREGFAAGRPMRAGSGPVLGLLSYPGRS